jgi:hypothetical protein
MKEYHTMGALQWWRELDQNSTYTIGISGPEGTVVADGVNSEDAQRDRIGDIYWEIIAVLAGAGYHCCWSDTARYL